MFVSVLLLRTDMTSKVCFLLVIVTITISVTTAAFIWPDDWLEEENTYELDDLFNPYMKRSMEWEYDVEKRAGYGRKYLLHCFTLRFRHEGIFNL